MLRVIAGTARGRRLKVPAGRVTRPTAERVREALFNIIEVAGKSFLDVFAGSGAVGIEALSRGAGQATFIEKHPRALKALQENLASTGLGDRAEVMAMDVFRALPKLTSAGRRFDFIFMDPPYEQGLVAKVLPWFVRLLTGEGCIIVETASREVAPVVEGVTLKDSRRYGDAVLHFYQKNMGVGQG